MHGLINRAIEKFVRDSYGDTLWYEVIRWLGTGHDTFEPMMRYDPDVTQKLMRGLGARLDRAHDDLLEDIGTYLVSHREVEPIRRLLRFSGVDFLDFLHALEDLPDRARLAVTELDLPSLSLHAHGAGLYRLDVELSGGQDLRFGRVMMGILRAMADDYGALVMLDHRGTSATHEVIEVQLLDAGFASGRVFDLGAGRQAI